jgi:N-acetylmuramoyl-L-alanine amidase
VRFLLINLLCLLAAAFANAAAFDWKIQHHEGRDYVPLDRLAQFYAFTNSYTQETKRVSLSSDRAQLEVAPGNREVMINGVTHWLAFPPLQDGDSILISRIDMAKIIEPLLRPQLIPNLKPVKTIVLDPGHGGHDNGAISMYGYEKDFALDVCLRARKMLEDRGFKVLMTRTSDVFIPLEDRPKIANNIPNSIFVSVHFNASMENKSASGFEVYSITPRGAPSTVDDYVTVRDLQFEWGNTVDVPSISLATSVYHAMMGNIPDYDRGVKHARFAVIRLATVPAVLVEGGFLSSPSESRLIGSAAWRAKLAESIVDGIEGYKNLAEFKLPPKLVADYKRKNPTGVTLRDGTRGTSKPGEEARATYIPKVPLRDASNAPNDASHAQ